MLFLIKMSKIIDKSITLDENNMLILLIFDLFHLFLIKSTYFHSILIIFDRYRHFGLCFNQFHCNNLDSGDKFGLDFSIKI